MHNLFNRYMCLFSIFFFLILEEIGFKKKQVLFETWFSDTWQNCASPTALRYLESK